MKRAILILFGLMAVLSAGAQAVMLNPNPGKVSEKEVVLSVYPLDTTAAAMFLVDRTEVAIRVDKPVELRLEKPIILDLSTITYHRVKILTDSGWDELVHYELTVPEADRVDNIKVVTYNLVNGRVVKTKLSKKNIQKKKLEDKLVSYSFTAPEVRKGSVIEVSYQHVSDNFLVIPELKLQREYPINFATASFDYPDYFTFSKQKKGYIEPLFTETYPMLRELSDELPKYRIVSHRYSLADVPALPQESSSLCPELYRISIKYEVKSASIQNYLNKLYSMEWSDVDAQILDSPIVKQCEVKGKFLDKFQSDESDAKAAIAQVRNAILNDVKWDGTYTLVPKNVRDAIKEGAASSATLNAIVASTLNSMGYKAVPVLLRSRDKGVLSEDFVSADAFTTMILKVSPPLGSSFFFDAASDCEYPDIINPLFLVEMARVYPQGGFIVPYWEQLTPKASATSLLVVDATIQPDGNVKGTLSLRAQGEASYQLRQARKDLKDEFLAAIGDQTTFKTLSFEDQTAPYAESAGFSLEFEQETADGEYIRVRPMIVANFHKEDYPAGQRMTPVDFLVKDNVMYNYTLHIPEGYEVVELPAAKSIRPAGLDMLASCRASIKEDGSVSFGFSFQNNILQVPLKHYDNLRVFWERLCDMSENTIVLKKK